MSKEILVVIGAGKHQTSLIKEAHRMGYYVAAVDINPQAEGFKYADESFVHSAYDGKGILAYLKEHFNRDEIQGVMTQAARGCILSAAVIARSLDLPGLSVKSAKLLNSKVKTTRKLNSKYKSNIFADISKIPLQPVFPIVIKTENSSGSSGVFSVFSAEELEKFQKNLSIEGPVIIEPFIEGRHLGVIGLAQYGNYKFYAVMERFLNPDRTIDYTIFPAELSSELNNKLYHYAKKTLDAAEFDFGPFQIEIILQPDGSIYFVEIEASVLGSYISEYMIPQAGVNNFIRDAIELTTEDYLNEDIYPNKYVCLNQYYYPKQKGKLKAFNLAETHRNIQFLPYLNSGEIISDTRMYAANALVCAKNVEEAKTALDSFQLDIEVQNETG